MLFIVRANNRSDTVTAALFVNKPVFNATPEDHKTTAQIFRLLLDAKADPNTRNMCDSQSYYDGEGLVVEWASEPLFAAVASSAGGRFAVETAQFLIARLQLLLNAGVLSLHESTNE